MQLSLSLQYEHTHIEREGFKTENECKRKRVQKHLAKEWLRERYRKRDGEKDIERQEQWDMKRERFVQQWEWKNLQNVNRFKNASWPCGEEKQRYRKYVERVNKWKVVEKERTD